MNAGNIILMAVGAVLIGFFFMLSDASPTKAAKSASGSPAQLSSAIASGQPVLLEFYADWCGPCRTVGPVVDEFAREVQGKAKVIRLNVDQHTALAQEYGVRSIPTFITLKQGKEASRQSGAISKGMMRSMLGN